MIEDERRGWRLSKFRGRSGARLRMVWGWISSTGFGRDGWAAGWSPADSEEEK